MEGTMKDGRKRLPAAAMVRRMCTVFAAAGLMAACPASAQPASRMPIAGLAKSWVLVAPSRVHPWDGNGGIITATSRTMIHSLPSGGFGMAFATQSTM